MKLIGFLILTLFPAQAFAAGVAVDVLLRDRQCNYASITADGELSISSSTSGETGIVPCGSGHDVIIRDRDGDYATINSDGSLQAG